MLLAPRNLVHETTTSTGTGNVTLSAVNGRVRFSDATYGFGTGGVDVFYYFLTHRSAAEWEIGTGHMSDANTLVRDTVLYSSNADALVSFSNGTKDATNDTLAEFQDGPFPIQAESGTVSLPDDSYQVVRNTTQAGVGIFANIGGTIYQVREKLLANRNYYVNVGSGLDTNDGLTVGTPFETIQHALDIVSGSLDLNVYSVTINVADGDYTAEGDLEALPFTGTPPQGIVHIIGNTTTWENVVIEGFIALNNNANYYIRGFLTTCANGFGISSRNGAMLMYQQIEFASTNAGSWNVYIYGGSGAEVGPTKISGDADIHYGLFSAIDFENYALNDMSGSPQVTFTTPVTINRFVVNGPAYLYEWSFVNPGNMTGQKFQVSSGAISAGDINTFLPGTIPGTFGGDGTYHDYDNNATSKMLSRTHSTVVTLTDGATVPLNLAQGDTFHLTAAGDRTILVPTSPPAASQTQKIIIRHEASGGARTLTLTTGSAGAFRFGSDITALSATASGKTDYIGAIYDQADDRWDVVSYIKGF